MRSGRRGAARPAGDMTRDELEGFREALVDRRRQLSDWIERLTEESAADSPDNTGEPSSLPTHLADLGSNAFEQDQNLGMAERGAEEVHEIDEALARVEDGTYGICERCGRPIHIDRLRARPWVVRCAECQAARESS